jgi:hypothetical protein
MWRHGDVFIEACDAVPAHAKRLPHLILAKGELTGHAHRLEARDAAELYEAGESRYLCVTGAEATLVHEEHLPIHLPPGVYRIWFQREYSPEAIRRVLD